MPHPFTILPLLFILAAGAAAQEEEAGTLTLIAKSPFLPPDFQPPGTVAAKAPPDQLASYEFRGVYQLGEVYYFNLYNVREKKGSWIASTARPGGDESPRIVRFNPEEDELQVEIEGKALSLSLIQPSDKPMPVQTAPRATQTGPQAAVPTSGQPPARRRVIRPSSRTPNSEAVRRRIVNQPASNR